MKKLRYRNKQSGFSLVELLVAVAIFSLFVVMTTTALSNILRSDRKLGALRATQENCRYILESIVREARGANGELDAGGKRVAHAYAVEDGKLTIYNTDLNLTGLISEGKVTRTIYSLVGSGNNAKITKKVDAKSLGGTFSNNAAVDITDPAEITITKLSFTIPDPPLEISIPQRLTISITAEDAKGAKTGKDDLLARTTIETAVSSRNY